MNQSLFQQLGEGRIPSSPSFPAHKPRKEHPLELPQRERVERELFRNNAEWITASLVVRPVSMLR